MPPGPLAALRLGAGAFWVADPALRVYGVRLAGVAPEASRAAAADGGAGAGAADAAAALAREAAAAAAEARGAGRLAVRFFRVVC